jgi:hypothetical protein
MPKTREEIEHLKMNWLEDACWDIETTEGFEEYKNELESYRKEMEDKWKAQRKFARICPLSPMTRYRERLCLRNECAWWDEDCDQCSIRRLASLVDRAESEDGYRSTSLMEYKEKFG